MPAGSGKVWETMGGKGGWWRARENQVHLTVAGKGLEVTLSAQARLVREVFCPRSFLHAEGLHLWHN